MTCKSNIRRNLRSTNVIIHSSSFSASITASKMATITLPSDIVQEVLKFVPYKNATKLVLTSKSWVKPLQIQIKEQRIAIIAEIRRLESSDLGEKQRKIKSDWDELVENERNFCRWADINTNNSMLEQKAAIALQNQRFQTIQANKNATFDRYCAIARKRQPIIDKIESLESKLDQCGKSETERFADLKRRQERYQTAIFVTVVPVTILFIVDIFAIIIAAIEYAEKITLTLSFYIFLIVSVIIVVLLFIIRKLGSVDDKLQLKVDRYENKKYID
ncbi:hypothetical protein Ddc_24777 [Ditylenchus destructor]|nr:hypothetical protein Ddc_24777 [Ditylenchus destructor]